MCFIIHSGWRYSLGERVYKRRVLELMNEIVSCDGFGVLILDTFSSKLSEGHHFISDCCVVLQHC